MEKCDVIVQLSSEEAGCLTIQEALKIGKPIVVTDLEILPEFNINESNAVILNMDMSNLDIEKIWNLPKEVKWQEPISEGWENIMKKKVFREKNKPVEVTEEIIAETEFLPKKEETKKTIKKMLKGKNKKDE